uniref:Uncharacterized protein n=1 Tax=Anguilla anguilla TaxID=7936 RepID=A0A0E9SN23_ANGAN
MFICILYDHVKLFFIIVKLFDQESLEEKTVSH